MKQVRHEVSPVPYENCGNPVEVARLKGWSVGTRLIGDEGWGPTIIEITAIGERLVLAKSISQNGVAAEASLGDSSWTFSCRDWQVVKL